MKAVNLKEVLQSSDFNYFKSATLCTFPFHLQKHQYTSNLSVGSGTAIEITVVAGNTTGLRTRLGITEAKVLLLSLPH